MFTVCLFLRKGTTEEFSFNHGAVHLDIFNMAPLTKMKCK